MFSFPRSSCLSVPKRFSFMIQANKAGFTLGDLPTATQGLPASSKHLLSTLQVAPGRSLESQST